MQTHPEKYSKGVVQAARDIVKQEGVGYLLAGLGNDCSLHCSFPVFIFEFLPPFHLQAPLSLVTDLREH